MRFAIYLLCLAVFISTLAHASNDVAVWTKLNGSGSQVPSYRTGAAGALVGDSIVIFGGFSSKSGSSYLGDTWSYNLVTGTWTTLPTSDALSGHTAVSYNGSIYVFGGQDSTTTYNTIRKFTTNTWSTVTPVGSSTPTARASHAAVVVGSDMYIFGGLTSSNTRLADLWKYSFTSNTWADVSAAGPAARASSTLVATNDAKLALFGGETASGATSDVWVYSAGAWTQNSGATGPSARAGHSAVRVPAGFVVYGGKSGSTYYGDAWRYSFASGSFTAVSSSSAPSYRAGQAAVAISGGFVIFGGSLIRGQSDELWQFASSTALSQTITDYDGGRVNAAAAAYGGAVYSFGGSTSSSSLSNDIVSYNTTSQAFVTYSSTSKPEARANAALAPVSIGLMMFGGKDTTTAYNDVWIFENGQWSKKTSTGTPPTARSGHSAVAYDTASTTTTVYVIGGQSFSDEYSGETWKYTHTLLGGTWALLTTTGSFSARSRHAAAKTASGVVVFGGLVAGADGAVAAPLNDLWILDSSSTWTQIPTSGAWPAARYGHSMVAVAGGVLVHGGYSESDSALGDAWRYDLFEQTWTQLNDLSVVPRAAGVMAATDSHVVILGGVNNNGFVGTAQDLSIGGTFYVSATTGSDASGTGSSSAPFATIQQAVLYAAYGSIVLQAGTYKGTGQIKTNTGSVVRISAQGAVTLDCESSTSSYAFTATSLVPVAFSGLTITRCSTGIVVNGARVRVVSSTLTNNAGATGAAASVVNGKLNVEDSTVTSNTADNGGAIYAEDSTLNVIRTNFTSNTAKRTGGAVYAASNVVFTATGGNFGQNTASIGAGVAVVGATASFQGVAFTSNAASSLGGAVYATAGAVVTIASSTATANTADLGAAAYAESSQFSANNFNATNNVANTAGGAVYVSLGSHSITASNFINNKAVSGAGIYAKTSSGAIGTSSFQNNQAQLGAGVYAGAKSVEVLTSVTFTSNNATSDGGAIYTSSSQVNSTGSTFTSNVAGRGAVFFSVDSRVYDVSGVFTSNKVSVGGAVSFFDTVAPQLTTPTLSGNTAPYGELNATALKSISISSAPSGSQNSSSVLPPVVIYLMDASGQVITSDSTSLFTASIVSSSKRATTPTLRGTRTVQAVNGVVTFNDLSVLADQGTPVSVRIASSDLQSQSTFNFVVSACQPGYVSTDGACVACPVGTYRGDADTECLPCAVGSYAPNTGSASCTPCPAGQYASLTGRSSCTFCNDGTSSSAGQSRCDDCPVGYYSNYIAGLASCTPCPAGYNASVAGSKACSACPAGTSAPNTGSTTCDPCIAGQYASLSGSTSCSACAPGSYSGEAAPACILCSVGTYASQPGSPRCIPCGFNRVTASAGATACVNCPTCPAGQFANRGDDASYCPTCVSCGPGTYSSSPSSLTCSPCAPGTFSSGYASTSCRQCPVGTYTANPGSVTCIACPSKSVSSVKGSTVCGACPVGTYSNSNGTTCLFCPEGAICAGNRPLNSLVDWYGGPRYYEQCFAKDNCLGANTCAAGYSGPLCSVCTKDHGRLGTLCISCLTGFVAGAWILGVALTIFFLVHMYIIGYDVRNAQITGKQVHPRTTSIRILMNHLQILGWLAILKVRWSTPIQVWFYIFSAVPVMNLSNFALDCTRGLSFYEQFFFFMLLPIIAIVGSCLVFGLVYWAITGRANRIKEVVPHLVTANVLVLRYILPIIMLEIWMAFDCIKLDSGNYIAADMRYKCHTDENKAARGIGVVVFIIFVFAGPFYAFVKTILCRKSLRYDTVTNSFAVLFLGFKEHRYFYEFIIYVKNIILIFFVILLRRYTSLEQFYSVVWLYIVVLFVFLYYKPYAYTIQNICEFLAILSQFGILITGIIYYDQGQDTTPTYLSVDGLFIALNTLVIAILLGVIYWVHPINQKMAPLYRFMSGKNLAMNEYDEPLKGKEEKPLDHNNIVLRVMADGPPANGKKGYEDHVSSSDAYSYSSSRASRSSRSRTSRSRSRSPYTSEDDEVRRRSRSPDSRSSSRTSASRTDSEAPEGRSRRRSLSLDSRSSDGSNSSASSEYRRTGAGGRKRSSSASSGSDSSASSEYGGRGGSGTRKRSYSDSSSSSESSSSDEAELRRGPKDDDTVPLRPVQKSNSDKRQSTSNYQDMNIGQLINNIEKLLGDEDK